MDTARKDDSDKLSASFIWLNITQFLGALNDNVFKLLIVFYLITVQGQSNAGVISAIAGAVFVIPFLIFSALSGVLADRISKQRIIVIVKALEVGVMLIGTLAFFAGSTPGLYAVLFLMASQSAFFAPSKYGIVPEIVRKDQLITANGYLESFTYLAVIMGTALAPFLAQLMTLHYERVAMVCVAVAAVGLVSCLKIQKTMPAGSSDRASLIFFKDIWKTMTHIRQDSYLFMAVLGAAYFMFVGAFVQINIIPYGIEVLKLTQEQSGYLFLAAAFGIGIGSVLSGRMSGRNIEFGIVPLGALGFALSAISLSIFNDSILVVIITVVLLGISAGVFIIPLNAFIQFRSPAADRGKILAASGFAGWLGVLIAAALVYLLSGSIGISAAGGFFIIGCITSVLTLITMKVLPDFTIRFICISILRIFYRIRSIGLENIPIEGPAMLVSNHVSWVDALILNATQQRRIRFLMQRELYNVWYLNPLLKLMGVIPISSEDAPRAIAGAFSAARKALDDGYMVCIFAEGSITRSGMTGGFKAGMEKIVKGRDCPVIPVYLGGLWGSIFSYAHGPLLSALPVKIPYPVTVIFGKSMSADSTADMVRQAVMELSCKYFISKQEDQRALPVAFAASARKHWKNHAVSDTTGKELTYGELFVAATAVSKVIEIEIGDDEKIGVLLPPSVGGAVVNIALSLLGRTVVNLNYSASLESVESAIKQCSIRHIISSELFMEKVSTLASLPGVIFAEDLKARISGGLKIRSWVSARFLPLKLFFFRLTQGPDDIAAIIFSSGSTGDPKGVQLSGNNILSNVEAVKMVLRPRSEDNICSALPFFHSLGYMATIWLPLLSGCSAAYHNNPMEGAKIAELVRQRRSTMLLAAPTFLLVYLRRAQPEDFSSLRLVITGAEKLQERVADSFEKKFGIRPLEGYGVTEMSPVIALSLPDTEIDRVRQIGSKNGSVGHPIPGVAVRIVDPESGEILPSEAQGLILARGPNIMRSYLNRAELTAEVIKDGWYITGDIGFMDKDGFLFITDRLARFSKIGGEMVPHQGIEDEYNRHISTDTVSLAVTSVPDEKRGEKIVVLYTKNAGTKEALQKIIEASAIPNLWKPNKDCYIELNEIPLLGSGKRDLKKMRELARELA